MKNMKFDIVIGNPPYGSDISVEDYVMYEINSSESYLFFIELGFELIEKNGILTYIVPISFTSSNQMIDIHNLFEDNCEFIKVSSFSNSPQGIFKNAGIGVSIFIIKKTMSKNEKLLTTRINRKKQDDDIVEFLNDLEFIDSRGLKLPGRYAKIGNEIEKDILIKMFRVNYTIKDFMDIYGSSIYYRSAGGRYYNIITPYSNQTSSERELKLSEKYVNIIGALLSTNLFWFYTQVYGDILNLKLSEIYDFPIPDLFSLTEYQINEIEMMYSEYLEDIERNAMIRNVSDESSYKIDTFKEYKIRKSKHLVDQLDDLIIVMYGLSAYEIDYIKNYEIEFKK